MKKVILSAMLLAPLSMSVSTSALANGGHGPAGCGLGTEVIFRKANEWHEHVLAALTNASASNTLAMISGTLGCEDANGPLKAEIALFMESNLDQLAVDSALGGGETLAALSEVAGIGQHDLATFNSVMRRHFDQIFVSDETTSGQVFDAFVAVMKEDATLAKYFS